MPVILATFALMSRLYRYPMLKRAIDAFFGFFGMHRLFAATDRYGIIA